MIESEPKTVFVVDDEESIRKFVCQILRRTYTVLVAASGEDAIRQSKEFAGTIDLLLSNVQMPGMTGLELGTKLNLDRPAMRVLLMSGFTSGMLVLNTGWHFIHKPFIPSQLQDIVAAALAAPLIEVPNIDEHERAAGVRHSGEPDSR